MSEKDKAMSIQDSVDNIKSVFRTGHDLAGYPMTLSDALALPNFPIAFKRVVVELIQEEIEPELIGTKLLDVVRWHAQVGSATFHTFSAMGMEDLSMAEGQEYPEVNFTHGGGQLNVHIGKAGLAVKITEEMVRYSQWDIISHHIKRAANLLARYKEKSIFNMINDMGVVVFDNANPTKSELGKTTGRGLDGAGNGSFTADDMFDMYSSLLSKGFRPDTILCHPLAWATFSKDPIMREHALNSGGLSNWFNGMPKSNVSPTLPEAWKAANKLSGGSVYNPTTEERVGTQTSTFQLPGYFPGSGMRIIPSPHVPFDPVAKTTSIIMLDSKNTGAIVVGEDLTMEEFKDHSVDIYKIKLRERYGLAVYHEGQGIAVAKNVSIEPNQIVLPPVATVNNLPAITRK